MAGNTVALLRGINVGGHNRLPMADLREIAENLGYRDVATYVQSGNLAMSAAESPGKVAERLHEAVKETTGIDASVVARTAAEWVEIIAANPFVEEAKANGSLVHVTLAVEPVAADALAAINPEDHGLERFVVVGTELYQSVPNGLSGGTLATAIDRVIKDPTATRRNWNTIVAIERLLAK